MKKIYILRLCLKPKFWSLLLMTAFFSAMTLTLVAQKHQKVMSIDEWNAQQSPLEEEQIVRATEQPTAIIEKSLTGFTFFSDRMSFEAASCPSLTFEDFEGGCIDHIPGLSLLDASTNMGCVTPGYIEPGIAFSVDNPFPRNPAFTNIALLLNFVSPFYDLNNDNAYFNLVIDFTNGGATSVGMDLRHHTASILPVLPVTLEIYDANGLLGTTTASSTYSGSFWGFNSSTPVTRIIIKETNPGPGFNWQGVDNIAFGNCCTTLTGDNLGSPVPAFGTGTYTCGTQQTSTATMGMAGTIGTDYKIGSVEIDITHTFDADLEITLVSPMGTTLNLSSDNGGSSNNYTSTVFMDGNPNITTGSAPFTGTFEAEGGTFATTFAGQSIMGDWKLEVCDDASGDTGTLNDFKITFCQIPVSCVTADEAPMIDTPCPGDIILCGAQNVSWTEPTATDNCDIPTVTSNYSPGDYFGVGTHTVTYTFEDLAGLTASCSFDVVINPLPDAVISQSNLPQWCQGIKQLTAKVLNDGDLTPPISIDWSTGASGEIISVSANGTYSVTITDGNGCKSVYSTIVNEDASDLLSAYTIIAKDNVKMYQSEVFGGGVGVINSDETRVYDNSGIWTFLRADMSNVTIDGSSFVNNTVDADYTAGLPMFLSNPYYDNNNVTVAPNTTMTLTGNHYGKILVRSGATLKIDNPNIYIKDLRTESNATISFLQPTKMRIKKRMNIGQMNTINSTYYKSIIYVDKCAIHQGSGVTVNIYARGGLNVSDSGATLTTYMTGLFISDRSVSSDDNVIWDWNTNTCFATPAPLSQDDSRDDKEATGIVKEKTAGDRGLNIYPNPTSGLLNIDLGEYQGESVDVNIYDPVGRVVWSKHINKVESNVIQAKLFGNQNQLYMLSVKTDKDVKTKLFVLNK